MRLLIRLLAEEGLKLEKVDVTATSTCLHQEWLYHTRGTPPHASISYDLPCGLIPHRRESVMTTLRQHPQVITSLNGRVGILAVEFRVLLVRADSICSCQNRTDFYGFCTHDDRGDRTSTILIAYSTRLEASCLGM